MRAFVVLVLCLSGSPFAQQDRVASGPTGNDSATADTIAPPELDAIVVTADSRQRLMETAQTLTVVSPDEWVGTSKSIADVLAVHTGIQTRRYGGIGSFQTVSVRGVEGSEALVLLDGIPLNSAMGGAVDLGRMNPMRLESMEVYKGFVPSRFGGNSLGGVINLRTVQSTSGRSADVCLSYGAYGTHNDKVAISHTTQSGVSTLGLFSFSHGDNDFPYLDRNNTPYNDDDDTVRTVVNGEFTQAGLLVHPRVPLAEDLAITSTISLSYTKSHIPAWEGRINRTAYYREALGTVGFHLQDDRPDRTLRVQPSLGYTISDGLRFSTSLDQSVGASHSAATVPNSTTEIGALEQMLSIPVTMCYTPVDWLMIEPTVALHAADINPTLEVTDGTHGDYHSSEGSLSIAADISASLGPIGATIGASAKGIYSRTEGGLDGGTLKTVPESDTAMGIWSAKSGVSAHFLDRHLLVYCNAGRYSNQPSLRERYGTRGGHTPNPTLAPETGLTGELGAKLRLAGLYAELVGFCVSSQDKIITKYTAVQSGSINIDGALVYGVETWLSWSPLPVLSLESRATFQHTEARTYEYGWYGDRLPNEPMIDLYETVRVGPFHGLSLRYAADLKSYYYRNPGNQLRVPLDDNFWEVRHHIQLSWEAPKHLVLICSLSNITNDFLTDFDIVNYGEPGYSDVLVPANQWHLSVTYSF